MADISTHTPMQELRELAKTYGIRYVGVLKTHLVDSLLSAMETAATQTVSTDPLAQLAAQAETIIATTGAEVGTTTPKAPKVKTPKQPGEAKNPKHFDHPMCQEMLALLQQVDVKTATITYNGKVKPILTEREHEILDALLANNYRINVVANEVGLTHTGVWQRLYGIKRKSKPAKGILGKLREYVAAHDVSTTA